MDNRMYHNSVDLTEDEDSRETIVDVLDSPQLPYYSYAEVTGNTPRLKTLSPCTPPPLTPICEIDCLREQKLLNNQHRTVPQLKRIQRPSKQIGQKSVSEEVTLTPFESKPVNTNYEYQIFQDKLIAYQSNNVPSKPLFGKEWTINKNGKKYKIVIPHNVLPSLNQSNGPVVINVPEVGTIMLKINPQFKDPSVSELQPFSLNFDEIMESTSEQPPLPICPVESISQLSCETDLLYDSRFCWIQPKYRNYGSSFKCNFSGFSKTDMQKARRCLRNFNLSIKKLENVLEGKKQDTGKKHPKNFVKTNSLIKNDSSSYIDDVINPLQNKLLVTNPVNSTILFQKLNGINFNENNWLRRNLDDMILEDVLSPNVIIDTENDVDYTLKYNLNFQDSMLHTKFEELDESVFKQHTKLHSQKQSFNLKVIQKKGIKIQLKHCFVSIVKDKTIEKLLKTSKLVNVVPKRNKSRQNLLVHQNFGTLSSKLIDTELNFKSELSFTKHLLILNEFNFENVQFESEFSKSNIIFAVNKREFPKKILDNNGFILAVKFGYVKLVDCDLLYKYLKGEIGPVKLAKC